MPPAKTVSVRRARPNDVPALVSVFRSVARERVYLYTEKVSGDQVGRMKKRLKDRKSLIAVAEVDGKVVGSLVLERGPAAKSAHLRTLGISVMKGFRGIGAGSALMEYAIDWARANHVKKITLGVFSSNPAAVRLYKKFGFELEGRLKNQFLIKDEFVDELLMGLQLSP
ncbi:MAG: GNAT family N-acetyltransferase [Thaumarchaeota archaeon]|nr:GNAT family N-acetyltransferase [Nitrososphaerota archaeon]